MSRGAAFAIGTLSTLAAGVGATIASLRTRKRVERAVAGLDKEGTPVASTAPAAVPSIPFLPTPAAPPSAPAAATAPGGGITFPARITGYWPMVEGLSAKERLMEGGHKDRKGKPLYTLEDFQAGKAPFVSVSGDWTIFPYGQRISLAEWPGVVFRITDTGGHFFGTKKVFRIFGREPFDVCVASPSTKVIPKTDATLYPGDHFDKAAKEVAMAKIGKPTAVGDGLDLLGADAV